MIWPKLYQYRNRGFIREQEKRGRMQYRESNAVSTVGLNYLPSWNGCENKMRVNNASITRVHHEKWFEGGHPDTGQSDSSEVSRLLCLAIS